MNYVEVTQSNVAEIMSNLGISKSMLLPMANSDLCKEINGFDCNNNRRASCDKYSLSSEPELVGKDRGGACPLYRLHLIFNNNNRSDYRLYAPINSLSCEVEDI